MGASNETISDEDRREVANQLRSIPHVNYFGHDSINPHDLWQTVGFLRTVDGRILFSDVQRLADLIDRPTCRWECDADGLYHSECGHIMEFTVDGPEGNGFEFCPFCGAEVVSDGD